MSIIKTITSTFINLLMSFVLILNFINTASAEQPDDGEAVSVSEIIAGEKKTTHWNLRNVDIRSVINEISKHTGKNFIIDPRVQGKITFVSNHAMDKQESYDAFLSMLQILGYAAIDNGDVIKIIPDVEAKTYFSTVTNHELEETANDEMIVSIITAQHVPVEQLLHVLRPLVPQSGHISVNNASNSIILAGRADNMSRIANIIARVDTASSDDIDIIPLQHALALDIVRTLSNLQNNPNSLIDKQRINLSADDRSNSILISGNQMGRLRMKVLITDLDQENKQDSGNNTQVIFLHFMRAVDIVPVLAGVAQASFSGEVGFTLGTITNTTRGLEAEEMIQANNANQDTVQTGQSKSTEGVPRVEIIAEPNTNSVIINAPLSIMRTLKTVIARLDQRPAQVLVEALIVEVDVDDMLHLGLEWGTEVTSTGSNDKPTRTFQPGVALINHKSKLSDIQARISAMARNKKADILSQPSIVVLDNHQAKILVGKEVSVRDTSYPNNAGGSAGATPFTTFKRRDVALYLYVTPQISVDNSITLKIDHGNDTLQNPADSTDTPVFNKSNINTSVLVDNGSMLVLGGLLQNRLEMSDSRIPILGDIPGIGRLFQFQQKQMNKKVLMVFLTPTILYDADSSIIETGSRYEHVRRQQLLAAEKQAFIAENAAIVLPERDGLVLPLPFAGVIVTP